jgi:hypothetical protein
MDPTTIGALIVSVITAVGVLIERSLKHMKRMKSRCFCAELDINTKSTTSSDRTSVDLIVDNALKRISQTNEVQEPKQNM